MAALASKKFWSCHWKSEAIVYMFASLQRGEIKRKALRQPLLRAISDAKVAIASGEKRVQSLIYKPLALAYPGKDLRHLLRERIQKVIQGARDNPCSGRASISPDLAGEVDIDAFLSLLGDVPPAHRWAAVKTWLGAWTTTHRLHEAHLLTCVVGCCRR